MRNYFIYLQSLCTLMVALAAACLCGCSGIDNGSYGAASSEQLEELLARGHHYIMAEQADSAIDVFATVANATAHDKSDERLRLRSRAYNNMGYVFMYLKHDYPAAYKFFLKALADAKSVRFEKMYPYVYLNLGNVKLHAAPDSAMALYRTAFYSAIASESPDIVNTTYSNLLNVAMNQETIGDIKPEMDKYEALNMSDSVPLRQFALQTHQGALHMLKGEYQEASESFSKAAAEVDSDLTPLNYESQAYGNQAEALLAQGDTLGAVAVMKKMEIAALKADTPEVRWNLYSILASIYSKMGREEIAQQYHIHHLELADSIFGYRAGHHLDNIETQVRLDDMSSHYDDLHRRHMRSRMLIIGGGIVLLLIIIFSAITYYQKKKATELLKSLYLRDRDLKNLERVAVPAISDESQHPMPPKQSDEAPQEKTQVKYRTSSLTADDKKRYAEKITNIAINSDALFQVGFSVDSLADMVGLKEKEVSQIINEVWKMNFNAWLNSYRCREASTRLSDPAYDSLTIEAVGESLGFRSRSHFASIFKQSAGMTPAEYRRVSRLV